MLKNVKGLVLAGGAATRLPNKTLLPTVDGRTVLSHCIHHLHFSGINDITVVVSPNSVLEDYIKAKRHPVSVAYQDTPTGVVDAIRCGWNNAHPHVVLCADNVFPSYEYLPDCLDEGGPCAQIRKISDPQIMAALDAYDTDRETWLARDRAPLNIFLYRFAGWMFLREKPMCYPNVIAMLNDVRAEPVVANELGWWDIGTVYSYKKYWKSYHE